MGVPQGTVLGLICFLIYMYINDFHSHILSGDALMYADDSNLSSHGNNIEELQSVLQACLTEASAWFDANRLVVNENKSTTMVITSPCGLNAITPLHIILNNNELPYCMCSKLLGVVIDNSLKWDKHIQYICAKISPKIGLINPLKAMPHGSENSQEKNRNEIRQGLKSWQIMKKMTHKNLKIVKKIIYLSDI